MFRDEIVDAIKSKVPAFSVAQFSSSVAMKDVAPIFSASAFLLVLREMTTIFSAPRAFAKSKPKWPRNS